MPAITGARLVAAVLSVLTVAAAGVSAEAASVSLTWNAPTTNADGSRLSDLAGYRIYLGTSAPKCPGASFHSVASPTTTPAAGQTVSTSVTALNAGTTYFIRVSAVDTSGNESGCSSAASGVAQADFDVTPAASTSFGSVAVGGTVDRTFTVQNSGDASIAGSASIGAPFSIVSGAAFSLAPGASRTVTVRFRPTSAGSFASNVSFTAGGDSVSRGVSGSTTGTTTATLSVSRNGTGSGTVSSSRAGIVCGSDCTETLAAGTAVTLAASPASGSVFAGWGGACRGTGTCSVTVSGATMVTATFNARIPADPLTLPGSPVPVVSRLSPASATAGTAALTLTVNGNGFVASSRVRWNGAARTTTFVSATQLRAAITAADLATARSVSVTVVTPAPGGGTSGAATFTTTPPPPPPAPGAPSVTRTATKSTTVTFTVTWGAVSGATSYRWAAAFTDGSAPRRGKVKTRSFQLQMPYHASGAAAGAVVCIRSVNASGQQGTTQACSAVPVPARPVAAPSPAPPPPPDWGWGTG